MRLRTLLSAALIALAVTPALGETLRVAAAGSLRHVLPLLVDTFEASHPDAHIETVYGASGQLSRQIERGAPFDLFLSANEAFVDRLVDAGLTADKGAVYAEGILVLFRPHQSLAPEGISVERLAMLTDETALGRLAIAQPEVAPYGQAAKAALEAAGVWSAVQPNLVFGENVAQAAQFASTGAADLAMIAHSLALVMEGAGSWSSVIVPDDARLWQKLVVLDNQESGASAFAAFLLGGEAEAIFEAHGFAPARGY